MTRVTLATPPARGSSKTRSAGASYAEPSIQRELQVVGEAAALDDQEEAAAVVAAEDLLAQRIGLADVAAVGLEDDVARLEAGARRVAPRGHPRDLDLALARVDREAGALGEDAEAE